MTSWIVMGHQDSSDYCKVTGHTGCLVATFLQMYLCRPQYVCSFVAIKLDRVWPRTILNPTKEMWP